MKSLKIEDQWYHTRLTLFTLLLLPFSWIFRGLVAMRYFFYRFLFFKKKSFDVPVIVVGNITVGGTGKTPFVIWLSETLQKKGYRPGIVSRGVGGKKINMPKWITTDSDPKEVGDEAVLLVKRTQCPMVVCVDRALAVRELLQKTHCNIVISDDGLQHYALDRQIEIVIVDGVREFGNSQLLPAGPLREPLSRLHRADLIVINGKNSLQHPIFKNEKIIKKMEKMEVSGLEIYSLIDPEKKLYLQDLQNKTLHALAGIGNPQRFFGLLREHAISIVEHIFPDHYHYVRQDIYFEDNLSVIMTEKDAVKCMPWIDQRHWCLPVSVKVSNALQDKIFSLLN